MIVRILCRLLSSRSARKANRARIAARYAYLKAVERGDTRGQHEAFRSLFKTTCDQLKAEAAQ